MTTVQRCSDCGGLFQFLPRGVCGDCLDAVEADFQKVRDFVRTAGRVSAADAATATGVDEERIRRFIAEGRVEFASLTPVMNESVCEVCGVSTLGDRHCDDCRGRLVKGLQDASAVASAERLAAQARAPRPQMFTRGR